MRTTLDVDEKLIEEVKKLTKEKSKGKAINRALEEYIRSQRIDDLRSMLGKTDLVDDWYEARHADPR